MAVCRNCPCPVVIPPTMEQEEMMYFDSAPAMVGPDQNGLRATTYQRTFQDVQQAIDETRYRGYGIFGGGR